MTESSTSASTVIITGASGLIGSALTYSLEQHGHRVIRAVRREVIDPECELRWDPEEHEIDEARLEGTDAVVHLAGENIAGRRWSEAQKQRLFKSRARGTRLLSEAMARLQRKPRVFACASAIGFYGNRGEEQLDENSMPGDGFLAELCQQWEAECQPTRDAGIRTVNMRIGVVLSPDGGALAKMLLPFKLDLGGVIGSGRQYFSWIALDDVVRAIEFVLVGDSPGGAIHGPVNLTAPEPVTNRQFTKALGRALRRPTLLPMPAFVARLAFGSEMADEMLLGGARIHPATLTAEGFQFKHPQLAGALRFLLS